jgi:hypothetical protein
VIYGSESWNTTDEDEYRLGVFERRVLRTILGPKKISDGQNQVRFNHELYQVFREPDIVATVRLHRLAWAGHVARREEDRPVQQTLRGEFRDETRTQWIRIVLRLDFPIGKGRRRTDLSTGISLTR